jgi:hypothetical protein
MNYNGMVFRKSTLSVFPFNVSTLPLTFDSFEASTISDGLFTGSETGLEKGTESRKKIDIC